MARRRSAGSSIDEHMQGNLVPWPEFMKHWKVLAQRGWKMKKSTLSDFDFFNVDRSMMFDKRDEVVEHVKKLLREEDPEHRAELERKHKASVVIKNHCFIVCDVHTHQ